MRKPSISDQIVVALRPSSNPAFDKTSAPAQMPTIVLLDVVVGSESGLALHAELRRDHPLIPAVVFITGRRDLFQQLLAVAGPSDDWIIKPWDPAELVARVRLILRRQGDLTPEPREAR